MVTDEFVQFLERSFIEQQIDSFARREFSGFVFAFAPLRASAGFGFIAATEQLCNPVLL